MAGDLELKVRIAAELGELRSAINSIRSDFKGLGASGKAGADQASSAANKLENELDQVGKKGKKAGKDTADGFSELRGALSSIKSQIAGVVTLYGALAGVKAIAGIADEYQQLQARLKLVSDTTQEYNRAQSELFQIAQRSRGPLAETIDTYAKLEQANKTLGKSQEQILLVTETMNKAIALTPVSAETAKATLVQFGQGLAEGALRGEELNSVLSQTPGLAQAIASGLGVNVGQLRGLAEEGKLTAEALISALTSVSGEIDRQFNQLPLTVGQALTQLKNDIIVTFGNTDVSPLTDAISEFRAVITDPATVEGLTTLAGALVRLVGVAAKGATEFADLGKQIGYLAASVTGNVTEMDRLENEIKLVDKALNGSWLTKPTKYLGETEERLQRIRRELVRQQEELLRTQGMQAGPNKEDRAAQAEKARAALAEKAKADLAAAQAAAVAKAEEEKADKAARLRRQSIDQIIESLTKQAATYGKGEAATVRYELAQLGATKAEQDRAAALVKQVKALKDKEEAEDTARKTADEKKRAEEQLQRDLANIQIRALENAGQLAKAKEQELLIQYSGMIAQLEEKGDKAGIGLINNLIDVEVAKARTEEIRREFQKLKDDADKIISDLRGQEDSLSNRVKVGDISQAEADVSQAEADVSLQEQRQVAIEQLTVLNEKAQQLAVTTNDPTIVEGANNIAASLRKVGEEGATGIQAAIQNLNASLAQLQKNMATSLAGSAVDGLTSLFTDIATGSKSASDAVKDFARGFAQSIIQMIAKALALQAVLLVLNEIPGGAAVASALTLTAPVKHTGGVVGRGGTIRSGVNPALFAAAPRYHTGGVAGLKPGEVPAILQTGEEVLSRNDPRNVMNGGGGAQAPSGNGVRILNVIDPNMVADYMASSGGEQTILNVLQRNSGAVKQVLG